MLYQAVMEIPKNSMFKKLENLTGNECYDKFGLKEDETILETVYFSDDKFADIKLVVPSIDSTTWCEMVLFDKNGNELSCTDVAETVFGEWELEYAGNTYNVEVKESEEE